jgi:hypothetical protein
MTDASSARRYSVAQIALGLFIVWQLVFLAGSNLLAFFPHGAVAEGELSDSRFGPESDKSSGLAQEVVDCAGEVADRWGFLTGQVQAWWLFAPDFPKQATFPAVELRWEDTESDPKSPTDSSTTDRISPVFLRSRLEPGDPHGYFKLPGGGDRLFHYESRLGLIMLGWDKDLVRRYPKEWREAVENRVRRQWKSIRAYLRWRILEFQEEHPDLPQPSQATLHIRIFRSPVPRQYPIEWEGPFDLPLARWKLNCQPVPGYLPVEMYDSIAERFVALQGN